MKKVCKIKREKTTKFDLRKKKNHSMTSATRDITNILAVVTLTEFTNNVEPMRH